MLASRVLVEGCWVGQLPASGLDLEAAHSSNEGCKAGKGLLAAAAHAHQRDAALGL